jgi:hypothetical protein
MSGHDRMNEALRRRGKATAEPEPEPTPAVPSDIDAAARSQGATGETDMNRLLRVKAGREPAIDHREMRRG